MDSPLYSSISSNEVQKFLKTICDSKTFSHLYPLRPGHSNILDFKNIGSVYRSTDTNIIKYIVSRKKFINVFLRFQYLRFDLLYLYLQDLILSLITSSYLFTLSTNRIFNLTGVYLLANCSALSRETKLTILQTCFRRLVVSKRVYC